MLNVLQQQAVAYLSIGMDTTQVATNLGVSRMTLCRWKRLPEFQAVERKTIGEMMGNLTTQCQAVARVLVEGALDAANALRNLVLKPNTKDSDRRMAAKDLLHFSGRFFDMMGFHAKRETPEPLAHEDLPDLDAVQAVGDAMRPGAADPEAELNAYQSVTSPQVAPPVAPPVAQASSLRERNAAVTPPLSSRPVPQRTPTPS